MGSFIKQIRWLFAPKDKLKFIFIAVLMAFSALLELLGIGVLAAAVSIFLSPDTAVSRRISEIMAHIMPDAAVEHYAAWAVLSIGILLAAKNIFALFIVNMQAKFIFAKRDELADRMFAGFLYADYETFSRTAPDFCFASITRLTDMANFILLPAMQITADIQVILLLTVTSVVFFPGITISGLSFMILAAAIMFFITNRANRRCGEEHLKCDLKENRIRQTGITGAKTVKMTASEKFFLDEFNKVYSEKSRLYGKLYTLGQIPRLTLESASILLASIVFTVMVMLGIKNSEIMLSFAVLTAIISRILPALSRCHYNMTLIRQNLPVMDSICSTLKSFPGESAPSGNAADASNTIELKNVSFNYKDGNTVFENFNLVIEPASSLAISGRSGRGKSTLIDLITGLLTPSAGTICAGGVPIANDLAAWRRQIAIVPQNIFLMEGTVAENVAFGKKHADIEKVKKCLNMAELNDFSPNDQITARGNLSGGQKQRIAIARALYQNAKILILDEATSALDAETEDAFCKLLEELKGKITIIVISHRESTLNSCGQRISL